MNEQFQFAMLVFLHETLSTAQKTMLTAAAVVTDLAIKEAKECVTLGEFIDRMLTAKRKLMDDGPCDMAK